MGYKLAECHQWLSYLCQLLLLQPEEKRNKYEDSAFTDFYQVDARECVVSKANGVQWNELPFRDSFPRLVLIKQKRQHKFDWCCLSPGGTEEATRHRCGTIPL